MKNAAPRSSAIGQRGDEGFGLRMDLGEVVVRARDLDRRPQHRSAGRPCQAPSAGDHAALVPVAVRRSAAACTGIASSTSLPTTTPLNRSGSSLDPSHLVAEARPAPRAGARAACRTDRRWCSARSPSPSASSSCAASAPEPAPNSQTSSVPVAASAWPPGRPAPAPNSGVISGAVTKSLPEEGTAPNLRSRWRSSPGPARTAPAP